MRRAIDELGYVPNRAARALVTQRTDSVALVVSESEERVFGEPFFASIVRGISAFLAETPLQLWLAMAASPEQPFAAVCTAVCAMKTAGELARAALAPDEGSGSYRVRLIDAVNRLDGPTLAARAQWEEL